MATLVASASAVSSHASAQPEENNVYNDSLSFSNNRQIVEKRRVSNSNNTQLHPISPRPSQGFTGLGNEAGWENDVDELIIENDGLLSVLGSKF